MASIAGIFRGWRSNSPTVDGGIVPGFRKNFEGLLSSEANISLDNLSNNGCKRLGLLSRVLAKTIPGKSLFSSELDLGFSIRRLKKIMVLASSLDLAKGVVLEPVWIDGQLKLITLQEKFSFNNNADFLDLDENRLFGLLSYRKRGGAVYRSFPPAVSGEVRTKEQSRRAYGVIHGGVIPTYLRYSRDARNYKLAGVGLSIAGLGLIGLGIGIDSVLAIVGGGGLGFGGPAQSYVLSVPAGRRNALLISILSSINDVDPRFLRENLCGTTNGRLDRRSRFLRSMLRSESPEYFRYLMNLET
ncbi:hypothetical protein A2276_04070 [candidate division WOR-1 bacterium RIFOXYA12_FULL_43_27]|uniref:Uncharacterized protein n=1 Tax=candidate division WOR-1 bacterium RIFOXYC2_FULL_46_14 TaxID=1802587 RepID=A0A1F4U6Y3_UNCSA|nr:MAG: hypothetical protein A2276_04070 [candidate division WOR-1 bacterium RIFOXYA12_FULL_43_27]OGC19134.1 MAG: hypothetical protein A2292_00265 [candidate division WOR-1 bacterium RIFOXYB2_FULL_46_45]OGC30122.1 MAG: hypothetical protein A2232_00265 [candidate division WOR-1 bacterium RIFOXYA2_FULL_46_56]OGC40724.1 MAG: hypothetical protein A2438_00270 [candidate division WOR-1 bacterium RIFOXYC2_FULL_46_14]